jgi:hypothetical protein
MVGLFRPMNRTWSLGCFGLLVGVLTGNNIVGFLPFSAAALISLAVLAVPTDAHTERFVSRLAFAAVAAFVALGLAVWTAFGPDVGLQLDVTTDPTLPATEFVASEVQWTYRGCAVNSDHSEYVASETSPNPLLEFRDWCASNDGAEVPGQIIDVFARAKPGRDVRIQNIEIANLTSSPGRTVLINGPAQGGWDPGIQLSVNLEESRPVIREGIDGTGRAFFGPGSYALANGESASFVIVARATSRCFSWVFRVHMRVNGQEETEDVSNSGRPFRICGESAQFATASPPD